MYILECSDGSYYTGSTKDIEKRLQEHQDGVGANHTKKRLPVTLVYYEKYDRIDTAFYREKQVQGWSRVKKEALINGEVDVLHILSECQNETHWLERYSSAFDSSGFDFAQPSEETPNPERSRRVNNENENQAVTEPIGKLRTGSIEGLGDAKKNK